MNFDNKIVWPGAWFKVMLSLAMATVSFPGMAILVSGETASVSTVETAGPPPGEEAALKRDTIIVARHGSGDFRNLGEAIKSIEEAARMPSVIYIKNGTYKEKLVVSESVTGVRFVGEDNLRTVITWDDHAGVDNLGTFGSFTLQVRGSNLTFENLTIENAAGPVGQAVALHTEGDRLVFRNCRMLGHQDTIFTGGAGKRLYFVDCYIDGTTDYIFGFATCWFENCTLHCKANSYITAASTPEDAQYGYIFNRCRITLETGVNRMWLGRPWRSHAMTLFMNCQMPEGIVPAGWHNWGREENELTARYMEYNNSGPGSWTGERAPWVRILSPEQAAAYTMPVVMAGTDGWLPMKE